MRKVSSIIIAILIFINIAACGTQKETQFVQTTSEETTTTAAVVTETTGVQNKVESENESVEIRKWTDSLGRTVEIPKEVGKIALSGPMAQIVLYALSPEKLVGFSADWSEDVREYIPEEYLKLPTLGQLYGGKGEINLEELLKAAPDVVIDIGEPKKSAKEDLNNLSEQTGIPFVHVTLTMETASDAFRMLGDLLGLEERAETYALYCEEVYNRAKEIIENVGEENLVNFLYVTGDEGLNVIAKDSYHAEIIDMFTNNLAIVEEPSSKGTGNEIDMEQILVWNPEYVIFAPNSIYGKVEEMSEWHNVSAIRDGNYWETPFGPYNWMGFPPSVQRYLGMLWMPQVLYPEYVTYDLKEEVVKYYEMFYHCSLTDEQYDRLTKNSLK
ncbi:MAG: ABC transporter substrate-binding protein [Eubacteriales bacterium]|nr:ABC transporter substrate-binding protein [Eubacteriales bacterium]